MHRNSLFKSLPILILLAAAAPVIVAQESLERGFLNPPPDCRPEVYWDWMGGLISKEGITKDLEAMAAQGVGGAMIMQMPDQPPDPRQWSFREYPGKVKCLSDEYFAMMNHTASEMERLGLNMSVLICPGWSHAGGPWVPPDKALKKLAFTKTSVTGPTRFDGVLPSIPVSQPFRGGNEIPPWNTDAGRIPPPRMNFYQDTAVLALPELRPDEAVSLRSIVDLTSRLDSRGQLTWDVPPGKWAIWRLALISENGMNHPAPPDGMGLECDRMDPTAVRLVFDGMVGRILKDARAKGYHSFKRFETDSYEAGYQDFGRGFQAQFQRLNRYDCTPWLPAWLDRHLTIGDKDLTERFRSDMVRTITALWIEGFYSALRRLADEHGLEWMIEPYWGANLDWRTIAARSTMAGAEFWVHGETLGTAFETAALYNRHVVWAESFSSESYNSHGEASHEAGACGAGRKRIAAEGAAPACVGHRAAGRKRGYGVASASVVLYLPVAFGGATGGAPPAALVAPDVWPARVPVVGILAVGYEGRDETWIRVAGIRDIRKREAGWRNLAPGGWGGIRITAVGGEPHVEVHVLFDRAEAIGGIDQRFATVTSERGYHRRTGGQQQGGAVVLHPAP